MPNKFKTREEWLTFVGNKLRPAFAKVNAPLPASIRYSIGFTSTGYKSNRIGECWEPGASGDKATEILIKPTEHKPEYVAGILFHELIHAADGCKNGHKAPFKRIALALGFEGKMTQCLPGKATMDSIVKPILKLAGPLPHAPLAAFKMKKKAGTRLLKAECPECGYVVRVTAKWLEAAGAPFCGTKSHGRMVCEDADDEGGEE